MSIDEYRKGCQCPKPPVYDPNTQYSSLAEHLPRYKKEREHLTLVNPISFNGAFRIGVRCTAFTGTDINWHGSVCTATNCDVYVNEAS